MTFAEKYHKERRWHGKVLIMEIGHFAMSKKYKTDYNKDWTIKQTAAVFGVSVGLVSENLKLADAIHRHADAMLESPDRKTALFKLKDYGK